MVPHAFIAAVVRTECAGYERKGISLKDDTKGILIAPLIYRPQISRNILLYRAAAAAGGGKAVCQRQLPPDLPVRQRLHRLSVMPIDACLLIESRHRVHRYAVERSSVIFHKVIRDLSEPPVASGLQHRSRHGDRPDSRVIKIPDVVDIRPSREGNAQPAAEFFGDPPRGMNSQRVKRPS